MSTPEYLKGLTKHLFPNLTIENDYKRDFPEFYRSLKLAIKEVVDMLLLKDQTEGLLCWANKYTMKLPKVLLYGVIAKTMRYPLIDNVNSVVILTELTRRLLDIKSGLSEKYIKSTSHFERWLELYDICLQPILLRHSNCIALMTDMPIKTYWVDFNERHLNYLKKRKRHEQKFVRHPTSKFWCQLGKQLYFDDKLPILINMVECLSKENQLKFLSNLTCDFQQPHDKLGNADFQKALTMSANLSHFVSQKGGNDYDHNNKIVKEFEQAVRKNQRADNGA